MGRRPYLPEPYHRRQVEALAGFGVREVDIARMVGVDPKTLRKYYAEELSLGHVKANVKVAEALFRKATGEGRESVIAAIFWLKARGQWRDVTLHELANAPEQPELRISVIDAQL